MPVHFSSFKNPFAEKYQEVNWKDGFPYSAEYQDRFFQDNAIEEIENIFIEPNKILERIKNGSHIHIGELGFGFGLNFFVTANFWLKNNPKVLNTISACVLIIIALYVAVSQNY